MDAELMKMLTRITAEEQRILEGKGIDRNLYTETSDFTVDSHKMLKSGKLIDIRPHTRFIHFPTHRHNYIEIMYMCSGKTVHYINGTNKVVLQAGDLLFLNQYSSHEILPTRINDVGVNFIVLPQFFDTAINMISSRSVIGSFLISTLCQNDSEGRYLYFKVSDVLPIQNLVENLIWSIVNRQSNNNHINEATMGLLLLQLMNYTDKLGRNDAGPFENRLILRCLEYLEENYRTASLTELSKLTNQSVSRLSRFIKTGTGSNFKRLLLQKRLARSAELLVKTGLSISDIIVDVGYDNTSYFYRAFKGKYGLSPSEYRRKNQKSA